MYVYTYRYTLFYICVHIDVHTHSETMLCVVATSSEMTEARRRESVQRQWAANTCAFMASLHDTFHADSQIIQGTMT